MWWKKKFVKHQKVSKFYENDCWSHVRRQNGVALTSNMHYVSFPWRIINMLFSSKEVVSSSHIFPNLSSEILTLSISTPKSILTLSTSIQCLLNVTIFLFFLRTSFWVNNSFTLLLEVPFLSVETYGRLFDVVATFKMQLINLQWNKN